MLYTILLYIYIILLDTDGPLTERFHILIISTLGAFRREAWRETEPAKARGNAGRQGPAGKAGRRMAAVKHLGLGEIYCQQGITMLLWDIYSWPYYMTKSYYPMNFIISRITVMLWDVIQNDKSNSSTKTRACLNLSTLW